MGFQYKTSTKSAILAFTYLVMSCLGLRQQNVESTGSPVAL